MKKISPTRACLEPLQSVHFKGLQYMFTQFSVRFHLLQLIFLQLQETLKREVDTSGLIFQDLVG